MCLLKNTRTVVCLFVFNLWARVSSGWNRVTKRDSGIILALGNVLFFILVLAAKGYLL